eukprot:SAG22_NODE_1613_length_3995_cov_4.374230_1_plen_125_part_00
MTRRVCLCHPPPPGPSPLPALPFPLPLPLPLAPRQKFIGLYKGLSLARKAFRGFRYLADLRVAWQAACEALRSGLSGSRRLSGALRTVQWVLMAGHIFWDNMMFLSHPIVGVLGGANVSANKAR